MKRKIGSGFDLDLNLNLDLSDYERSDTAILKIEARQEVIQEVIQEAVQEVIQETERNEEKGPPRSTRNSSHVEPRQTSKMVRSVSSSTVNDEYFNYLDECGDYRDPRLN